jgi:hypothetical protein
MFLMGGVCRRNPIARARFVSRCVDLASAFVPVPVSCSNFLCAMAAVHPVPCVLETPTRSERAPLVGVHVMVHAKWDPERHKIYFRHFYQVYNISR